MLEHDIIDEEWTRYDNGGVLAVIKGEAKYRGSDHAAIIWGPAGVEAGMLFDARKFGKITSRHVEIACLARAAPELARTVRALMTWAKDNGLPDDPAWAEARLLAVKLDEDLARAKTFGQTVSVAAE